MILHKNVPYVILYQWTKFQCHTFFPSQDIKQNMLLCSSLDNWWHHKFKDLSLINLLSNGWQGEKGWRTEIQKSEYLENEKNFLDETKNNFHSFERAIICRLRHMKNKDVRQSHTSPRNSEAKDVWKVARHPPSRCVVAYNVYSF